MLNLSLIHMMNLADFMFYQFLIHQIMQERFVLKYKIFLMRVSVIYVYKLTVEITYALHVL